MKRLFLLIFLSVMGTVYAQIRIVPFLVGTDGKCHINYSHADTVHTLIRKSLDKDHGFQLYESSVVSVHNSDVYNVDLYTGPSEKYENDGRSSFFSIKVTSKYIDKKPVLLSDKMDIEHVTCILANDGFVPADPLYTKYNFGNQNNKNYIKVDMAKTSLLLFAGAEWFPDASVLTILWLHNGKADMVFNKEAEIVDVTQNDNGYLLKLHEGCLYFDEPDRKPKCSGLYISKKIDSINYYDSYPVDKEKEIIDSNKGKPFIPSSEGECRFKENDGAIKVKP